MSRSRALSSVLAGGLVGSFALACAPPLPSTGDTGTGVETETGAPGDSSSVGSESESGLETDTGTDTWDDDGGGDDCPEDPKIVTYELSIDGHSIPWNVDVDELCEVAGIAGASVSEGLVVSFDCVGGAHSLEIQVEVEGAPDSLALAPGQDVQLRLWGARDWASSMNVWVRDTEGAVLLAWYEGLWLPDDVPAEFAEDYAPDAVSDGLYMWVDELFSCPIECGPSWGDCFCQEELALGVRFPGFAEAIIEMESAGAVPGEAPGFAAVNRAELRTLPEGCFISDLSESWFDLVVLAGAP